MSVPPLLPAHARLGGYEIIELVGKGGMGEVYRARQVSMDRSVALKVLSPRLAAKDPSFAQQFIAEARSAGRLNHANIVAVHDVASAPAPEGVEIDGPLHFFSMDFIEGETVKDVLERQGRLEPAQVARVMRGMAEAMVYAQAQGLIHRDIKPDNIMLVSDGSVKLADLGLATDLEAATNEAGGKVMGTPLYMSPEQARALALDHSSDQYSLGATLYHCLTGRPPFSGDSARAIMKAHVVQPVPDPRDLRDDVPEGWRQLCMRLLAKEPAGRYADATAMRVAIEAAARSRITKLRTNTVGPAPYVARPKAKPSSLPLIMAGTVVAAVVIAVVVLMSGALSTPETRSHPLPVGSTSASVGMTAQQPRNPLPTTTATSAQSIEEALAQLPRDNRQRLAGLLALVAGPFKNSPERRRLDAMISDLEGDLLAAETRADAERNERLAIGFAAVEAALAAGRLADAGDHLGSIRPRDARSPDEVARLAQLRGRLDQALQRLRGGLAKRIAQAADAEACDALATELQALVLQPADRGRLTAALSERRSAIDRLSSAGDRVVLVGVISAVEDLRRNARYSELQSRIEQLTPGLKGTAGRATAAQYNRCVRLAARVEADLVAQVKTKEPEVTLRLAGGASANVKVTQLAADKVVYRRGPTSSTADRGGLDLAWMELAAVAVPPGPERLDALRAFAWHWRLPMPEGDGGDRGFAQFLVDHDRRLRPLDVNAPSERDGQLVMATYDFVARGAGLVPDWVGDNLRISPRGLQWDNAKNLPTGKLKDKDLPTIRWRTALRVPVTLTAKIAMDGDSALALGLSDGKQSVRILLVNRGHGDPVRVLTIDDAGLVSVSAALGIKPPPMTPERPVPIQIQSDEGGVLRLLVAEVPLVNQIPRLDPSKPITVVIQTTGPTRSAIPWLQVRGLPVEPQP